jgi:hypothetical protein
MRFGELPVVVVKIPQPVHWSLQIVPLLSVHWSVQ